MRKLALLAAAAGLAAVGSVARADFTLTHSRTPITSGMFAGDDLVTLTIQQTGTGTAQTGTVISFDLTESSVAASPKFFIRTWSIAGGGYDATVTNDTNADFVDQGETETDLATPRPDRAGSSARVGDGTTAFQNATLLQATPTETATTYTDGQSVPTFDVKVGENGTTGYAVTTPRTLALAVIPSGQDVTFHGTVSAFGGTAADLAFSVTDTPEPASLSLLGIGAAGLLMRRRRA